MGTTVTNHQTLATPAEIAPLRSGAERDLGIVLTPENPKDLLLSEKVERPNLHRNLRARGYVLVEIEEGKADLGFIATKNNFIKEIDLLPTCKDPSGVESFAGQRFAYHSCTALAFNLRYGMILRTPPHLLEDPEPTFGELEMNFQGTPSKLRHPSAASNAFFMGKTVYDEESPLTVYSKAGVAPILKRSGVRVTERMKELDQIQLLLAIDLQGYSKQPNRLDLPFIATRHSWCLEAACPPAKEHIHILGRVHSDSLPSRDRLIDEDFA